MFRRLFKEHGTKDVVTLFHSPMQPASSRVLTLLKQTNATAASTATEDQMSSHDEHNKEQRMDFELDVTEAPPTPDQLKSILEYLPRESDVGKIVSGAKGLEDAVKLVGSKPDAFVRPLTVDWNSGKLVVGDDKSAILAMLRALPKETDKV
ncbi:thioredoxin-like protein [Lineolata rhizophorae]|uniref:Thioredoxin-like protein n=1 Tax=Lineolata rhizophorae TaxID=578093 RepID=A0A6A6P3G1_9PEZI|nr:thioredoxin-like protein [Lineolata rhizophorae]